MRITISVTFLIIVGATCTLAQLGGLSEEIRAPFPEEDIVPQTVERLSPKIRFEVMTLLSDDPAAQNAVRDSPVGVLAYRFQIVAGTNYFVRAELAKYVFHLRIYMPLGGQPAELHKVKGPLEESAPIEHFQ